VNKVISMGAVDATKVGLDVGKAILAGHNNTVKFADVPDLGVPVLRGPTLDGLGKYYREVVEESPAGPVDVAQALNDTVGFLEKDAEVSNIRIHREYDPDAALAEAREMLSQAGSLSMEDRERAFGYLEGAHRVILVPPSVRLTEFPKVPGLDGQKMSKSYGNIIPMREDPKVLAENVRRMVTDPARVRRSDPGEPERCPVWQLHKIYTTDETRSWAAHGCRTAGIGCLDCKQPVIDAMLAEQQVWRERAQPYLDDPALLRATVDDGCQRARAAAGETMREVRGAMGLVYD
jgi:hypothetical protein